jgi:hypothetical protein
MKEMIMLHKHPLPPSPTHVANAQGGIPIGSMKH